MPDPAVLAASQWVTFGAQTPPMHHTRQHMFWLVQMSVGILVAAGTRPPPPNPSTGAPDPSPPPPPPGPRPSLFISSTPQHSCYLSAPPPPLPSPQVIPSTAPIPVVYAPCRTPLRGAGSARTGPCRESPTCQLSSPQLRKWCRPWLTCMSATSSMGMCVAPISCCAAAPPANVASQHRF